jgi:hypothetical protein
MNTLIDPNAIGKCSVVQIDMMLTSSENVAEQLSWLIRGFFCNVCNHNLQGTTRRAEALAMVTRMACGARANQLITFDEYNKITREITEIETSIYPGCSLL